METRPIRPSAIRWSGLTAFVAIVVVLMLFSWLFLNTILKWTMEHSLGTLNGAEVNIAEVDHRWSPLGITVREIQLTDPSAPSTNRVVVGELTAEVNVEQLLLGRLHLESVISTGIRVAQARSSAGEVYQLPDQQDVSAMLKDGLAQLDLTMPSSDEILARLELKTPAAVANAKIVLSEQKQRINDARQALPTEEKLKEYEAQVKRITSGDISNPAELAQRQQQFDQLKKQFEQDKAAIVAFKEVVQSASSELKETFAAVKAAPQQDMARAQQLMQLNSEGLGEITGVIFGQQLQQWSQYVLLAYEQLAPMLARSADVEPVAPARGEGQWFEFSKASAPPSFLIKMARTEFSFGDAVIDVDWENITHQHQQLGQPTVYRARGAQSGLWQALNLNGELALSDAGVNAKQQWQIKGIQLSNLGLSQREEFTAKIISTLLDSEGSVSLRDSNLAGESTVRLADLVMSASATNKWANVVAKALEGLNRLDIQTDISGAMMAPNFSFSSDLDRQLGDALKTAAMDQAKTELSGMRGNLQSQANGFLGENQEQFDEILSLLTMAENREERLQKLLQAKLQDQLKDRLKGFLGGG